MAASTSAPAPDEVSLRPYGALRPKPERQQHLGFFLVLSLYSAHLCCTLKPRQFFPSPFSAASVYPPVSLVEIFCLTCLLSRCFALWCVPLSDSVTLLISFSVSFLLLRHCRGRGEGHQDSLWCFFPLQSDSLLSLSLWSSNGEL